MAGRKTLREELEITRRYSDLSAKAFKLITKKLDSAEKSEQNFALDWLKGGFAKMIPQTIAGDKKNPVEVLVKFINGQEDNRNSG